MSLALELVDVLGAAGAAWAVGSAVRGYFRARSMSELGKSKASVLIQMTDGTNVRVDMPADEAERLVLGKQF